MNWEMRSDCYKILLLYFPSSLWIYPLERDLWGKILSDAWFFSFCCLSLPFFFWFLKLLFKFLNFSFILGTRKFLCYFKMYENLWIHIAVWFKSTILHIYLSWNLSSTFAHLRARFWNMEPRCMIDVCCIFCTVFCLCSLLNCYYSLFCHFRFWYSLFHHSKFWCVLGCKMHL